ncbi:MAG: NHL repeat-containing protein [Halobacteriales archaeon]
MGPPASLPAPLDDCGLTLASPVDTAQDEAGNVWVADAGHNRLVVVDADLQRLLAVVGSAGTDPGSFDLPLRLAHHPNEPAVFVSDTANGRVQRLEYTYEGDCPRVEASVFAAPPEFHPNGVAVHEYWDGLRVVVADEFYHEGTDLRGRLVVFDGEGSVVRSVRALGADNPTPLYWPQGLDIDDEGRIYVANTGYGVLHDDLGAPEKLATVVRCTRTGEPAPFEGRSDEVLTELPMPRDVAVVGTGRDAQIFVPDAATGRVHVFTSVGIEDAVVPEDDADLRDRAGLEEGIGLPHDGHAAEDGGAPVDADTDTDSPQVDTSQDRFRGPVGVAPFDGVSVDDSDADDPTLPVLLAEGLAQRVGAYAVDIHRETGTRLGAIAGPRTASDQFSVPTGSAVVPADAGSLGGCALVADGANGRLQRLALDAGDTADALTPIDLPATRFPFGVAYWPAGADGGRLFVTDYTAHYRDADGGQVHVYAVDGGAHPSLSLVHSFAPWGLGDDEVKLPRGLAVDPLDDTRARVFVTDSLNGRVGVWTYDWVRDAAEPRTHRGNFGHYEGGFWNPSDVAVGDRGVYVADENNNRVQRFDGDEWHAVGSPGYDDGHEFLLPISLDTHEGTVFVLDLVSRAVEVFAEDGSAPGGLRPVDAMQSFGGHAERGELWLPYLLSVGDVSPAPGVDIVVPDSTLHVAQHYTWSP